MEKSQRMRERASKKGGKKDRAANIAEGSNSQVRDRVRRDGDVSG
jgi:hypothetical protein